MKIRTSFSMSSLVLILAVAVAPAAHSGTSSGAAVRSVDSATWKREVLTASKPVLVDFYATWCGWCTKLTPIVDQVAIDMPEIKVVRINVDQSQSIAQKYAVDGLPTLILFNKGKPLGLIEGYVEKDALEGALKKAMGTTRTRGSMKETLGPFSAYPRTQSQ